MNTDGAHAAFSAFALANSVRNAGHCTPSGIATIASGNLPAMSATCVVGGS